MGHPCRRALLKEELFNSTCLLSDLFLIDGSCGALQCCFRFSPLCTVWLLIGSFKTSYNSVTLFSITGISNFLFSELFRVMPLHTCSFKAKIWKVPVHLCVYLCMFLWSAGQSWAAELQGIRSKSRNMPQCIFLICYVLFMKTPKFIESVYNKSGIWIKFQLLVQHELITPCTCQLLSTCTALIICLIILDFSCCAN